MSEIPPSREALEQLWRNRLNDARLRLDFARTYLREVQRDFKTGDIPSADGDFAYKKALRAENAALAEYHRILVILTELSVNGKLPTDADDSFTAGGGSAD